MCLILYVLIKTLASWPILQWFQCSLEFLQPLLFLLIFLVTFKCLFSVTCIAEVKENSTPQGYHNNGYKLRQVILALTFSDVNWKASAQLAKTASKQDYTMYNTCQQLELVQGFSQSQEWRYRYPQLFYDVSNWNEKLWSQASKTLTFQRSDLFYFS